MPKPTKSATKKYTEDDFTRELVQADKRSRQNKTAVEREKRQKMADLNRQYAQLPGGNTAEDNAKRAAYYRNMAQYGADYGVRAASRAGTENYKIYAREANNAYQYEDQLRRAEAEFGGKIRSTILAPMPSTMRSKTEVRALGQKANRDSAFYRQMEKDAEGMGDWELFVRAKEGQQSVSGTAQRYLSALSAENERQRDTNPGLYYAQSMSRDELEAKVKDLRQKRDTAQQVLDTTPWSDGMGGTANSKAISVDRRIKELNDELEIYEQALQQRGYWDNTAKYEEFVGAFTENGKLTPEAQALAEQGKAAYERDKAEKRPTSAYAGYASMAPSYQTDLRLGSADDQERRSRQDTERPHYAKTYEERGVDDGYLSEAQKQLYYALYARDPEIAREYLTLAHEQAENAHYQAISDYAGKNILTQFYGMQGAAITGLMSGLDPYGEFGQALSKTSEAITRGGAQAWNEVTGTFDEDVPILGGKGLGDLYGLGVSMMESGIVAAASAAAGNYGGAAAKVAEFLGTALMGSGAAASDYRECLDRGMTKDQAATHGLAAGIAEAAFEYISIDKLVNQDVTRGLIKNFFTQGGVEASEEVCTSVANRVTDALLARAQGYDTQIEQRVKELLAMGVDRREAERKAEQEWLTEVINDGIGGFLSGGMMTVGNTVGSWNEYRAAMEQNRMEGQTARQSGQTDALRQYAEANDLGWYGQEIDAKAVKSGAEPVQNAETGERIATPPSEARNDSQKQTRQEKRQERQAQREQKRQLREQSKQDRQIGSDTQRVQAHIQEQFSGKSIQEQTALRDQMIEQYGNGIAPAVYEAISAEATKKAASLKSADEIRAARDQAVKEAQDRSMKRAIADGYDQAVFGQAMRSGNADEAGRYFQQLRNTGEGGMSMTATVKAQDGQERQIAITGMTEDGRGVKLADGSTVAVSKLQADADTMDAIQRISELEMGADADAVLQAYIKADRQGADGYRWLMDYSLAYEQGRTGKLSLEEAVKRSSLDQRTVMEAYTLGQREAHQSTRSAVEALKAMPKKEGITGKTSNIDTSEIEGVTLNESEREQFELANKIFSLIGVDVKWTASAVKNGRYVGANGSYLNGAVTLDVHAGRNFLEQINSGILATTGHELTHFLQQYAPEQYQALKEFLFRQIVQSSANGETRLERLIWEKQRRASSKLSRKAAEDEVVADACQTMLRDSKAIREFAQQDEKAAKGVARWLDKWFGKLKQAFSRSAQLTEEARFVDSFAKEVRQAFGKLWDEALREAVETHDRVGNIEKTQQQNSDRDTEYLELAKDPEKNAARLQEMVDEAAKRAGYDMELYHGSKKGGGFTVFKDWQYFTPNKAYAERYMERDNPDSLYHVYVKSERMFDTRRPECREIFEQMRAEYGLSELQENGLPDWTDGYDISDFIEENGLDFDGVVLDEGGDLTEDGPVSRGVSYIIRNSEQVKSADPVTYDDSGNVIPLSERFNTENQDIRYSERDYDLPSDLELMDRAIEGLSEAGGEEYWKALLETDPGLAEDVKGYKDQARKLAAAEKRLADYKKQMQLGGNRKLNTRGITSLSLEMMKTLDASDAKGRGVAKQVTQTLTAAYQKALDAIDKGTSDADAWDIVYNEGVVPAAEIIAKQGTHSEKTGRGWITSSLESYYGEGGMQAITDTVAGYVGADFATNRYRKAIQPTIADRIVERTEKRMQKQVDAATERATEAERINKRLTEDRDFWKNQQAKDSETVTFLNERLKEARQDLRDNKSLSSQERRNLAARIKSLQVQINAKKTEAKAWKQLAETQEKQIHNLKLEAMNERVKNFQARMEKNRQYDAMKSKLEQQLEDQVERERKILEGKLKPQGMQRLLKAEREKAEEKIKQHKEEVFRNYKDQQQQGKLRGRIKNLSDDMKRRMTNPSERAYVPASLYGSMTQLCDALDDLLAPGAGTKAEARYRAVMDKIHGLAAEYQAVKDLDDPTYSSEYDEEIQHEINELVKTLNGRTSTTELSTEELQKVYNILKYINYCMTTAKDLMGSTQFKDVYAAMRSVAEQQKGEKSLKSLSHHEKAKRLRMLDNLSVMRSVEMMSGWDRNAALYQLFHAIEQGTDASWAWVMDYNKSLQDLKTGKNEKAYRKALTEAMDFGITDEEGLKVTMTKMQAIQILMTAEREAHNDKLLHLRTGGAVIRNAEDIQNGKGAKATSQTVKVTPELLQKIQDSMTDWDRAYMKAVREYFQREGRRTNEILYKLKHRVLKTEEFYVPYSVDKNYLETNLDERQAMSMWVKTPGSTNALQQKAKQPVIIDGMDAVMERHVKEIADYIGLALPIRDFSKVYNGMLKTGGDNPLPVKETIDRAFGSKGQHLLTQAVIDVQGGSAKQNWSSGISDFLSGLQSAFVRSALINPSVTIKQAASYIAAESILSHRALVAGNRATFSSDETKSPALIAYLFANPEGKTAQRIYNEIDSHTSLHYQRRLGMSQAEIANESNRTGKLKRRMNMIGANMEQSKIGHAVRKTGENLNPVTWIQRMDVATTATLWVACKEQARMDGMKAGTAEFWQRTTELYERCLRETQPMYDGLHRTAHQKQAGGLVQFLFPFRTVPIQNHGQLAASYEALKASKNKSKAEQAEAKRFFAKTVWAQTESAFIFSLMTFLAAALKRKTKKYRDEDEELTALSAGKGLLTDVGSTLFSVLAPMYGSELVNIGSRALDKFQGNSGYTYDAFSVGVVDMLNDLSSSFDKIAADFVKIARGEDVSFGDVGSHGLAMLLKAAKLAGIPADTVRTYFNGIVGNVKDIANGRIPALNDESWERATGVNAKRFFEAWEAGDEAKMQTVLNEVRQSGKSEDSIANAFNSYAKDAYENNGLSLEQYADYLDKTGMFDAEKISGKVKNLVRDEFQAGERSEDEAISALTGVCGMDADEAWKTVQRWEAGAEHEGEEDYSYSQYEDLREALDAGKSLKEAGKEYLAHGYTEEQITAQAVSWLKDQVNAGKINENRAIQLLRQYKGMDADKAWKKVQEWQAKAEHAEDEDYSWSQYDEIDAAIDGNKDIKALVNKLTTHGVEEKSVNSHVKSYLIQRYEDKAVTETQFRNQLSRYCGIVAKKDVDEIVNNANCFRDSGFHYSELKTAYNAKELSGDKARQMLVKYGGLSKDEAKQKTRFWDFETQYPDANLSIEKVNAYYDTKPANYSKTMEQAGISVQSYVSYCQQASKAQGTDLNHDGRTDSGSKKAAVMRIIDGLNLTRSQKDALYYLNGWSPKTIYEAPWH